MSHPRTGLDKELNSPLRLSIVAALAGVDKAEFSAIRDSVDTTDAELSRQITRLSDAGYVDIAKGRAGRYAKTWLSITARGREVLQAHVAALKAITG
ncbi:transcriptional regulator [Microbacterium sp. MPKO10]|uniref:transcriptional regulator n=1 Tax=Microbacterium sp. MPKO10 TaxID=2989818 RepID=UPI00223589A8|nr:transcriptional regulator [Microbacterium sp. MPKO10]MCW4457263.1 transcriptional regulator [Microbacterium sp. MPKO10]